jgi:hypothetical protein
VPIGGVDVIASVEFPLADHVMDDVFGIGESFGPGHGVYLRGSFRMATRKIAIAMTTSASRSRFMPSPIR